jgi:hypothetical protein
MASSRRRFAIWACVLGAATLAVGIATTALAGKGLKTKSETENVDSGENGDPTARCGQGTKAVSGGFEAEFDPAGPTPFFVIAESRRSGGREWTSAAFNDGNPGDLTSFAYCRDQKLKTKSKTTEVDPGDLDSVTARCKQGEKAFSGGFAAEGIDVSSPTFPIFFLTESLKQGKREWTVSAYNQGDEDGDLTAYVHCRKGKGVKTKQADETLSPGEFERAEARCSGKQRLVSGGFDLTSDWSDTGAYGMESKKVGKRGWEVAAASPGGAPHDLIAYAYCEKKKKKK